MTRLRATAPSRLITIAIAAACATSLGACSTIVPEPSRLATGQASGAAGALELTVFGAASLKQSLQAVATAYEAAVPGVTLSIATDSSATLRTQIEQGAPADVFLSADQKNPRTLAEAGLTDGPPIDFAGNHLTIIVPSDNPGGVHGPLDLARPRLRIVAAGTDVPISVYADRVVAKLGGLAGYPENFASAYATNIVSREQNVQAVVAKIELGEGDAAIVYETDARTAENVLTVPIPVEANVPATYAGVVVAASARRAEAHAFLDWLAGAAGLAVLARFGFLPPS